jgi:hypothetical protein
VNRTGVPGSPAKRCAVNPVAFESPAFFRWMVDRVARCPVGNRRSGLHGPRTFDPSTIRAHGEATRLVTGPVSKTAELRPGEFNSRPLRLLEAQADWRLHPA